MPAQPLDSNYKPLATDLYDPVGLQYTAQTAGTPKTASDGTVYAPGVVQLAQASNSGLPVSLPAIVQKAASKSTGSVATLAATFTTNNVAGNSIVVVAGCGNGTAMTVADSAGNVYTSAIAAPNSTTFAAQIFYAVNIAGGANTVTVTNAGTAASMAVELYEVSGLITQAQAQPGQTSTGTGTGTTATTSAIAPSIPNSLAFVGVAIGTAVVTAFAAGSGLTYDSGTLQPTTPAGLFQFASLSGNMGTISGLIPTATWTGSEPWAMAAAIFKPVTLGVEGTVRIGGYNYTRVTTAATTLVKTGAGVLHAIVVNKPTSTATIEADDALTNTTPIIGILGAFAASIAPFSVTYDVAFTTGLSVTVGTATVDATIVWK